MIDKTLHSLPIFRIPVENQSWVSRGGGGGGGGGGTRGVRHTGMCRCNRSLFWEKSLNIGYGFELENP